ncbi:MAG: hypothetical protein AAGI71_11190 [Bacteroidota bacterium]
MTISGTLRYQDLEGGFWGLIGDDGQRYRPVDPLPDAFQQDGLRVDVEAEPVTLLSIAMWGRSVRLHAIRPHAA